MIHLDKNQAIAQVNDYAKKEVPFLLIASYKCDRNFVIPADQVDPGEILYSINGFTNVALESY